MGGFRQRNGDVLFVHQHLSNHHQRWGKKRKHGVRQFVCLSGPTAHFPFTF